jgi:hypothetical protein
MQGSEVREQRSAIRDQRSEVRGQRSEKNPMPLNFDFCALSAKTR